jgi:hypothetical protein
MATLHVEAYPEDDVDFPSVCMKCGAPASFHKRKTFSWYPPWVAVLLLAGIVPFAILAIILTKRRSLDVPLCEAHKRHWGMRQLLVLGTLLGLFGLGVVALIAVSAANNGRGNDAVFGTVCLGWVILMLGWLVLAVIVQYTTIRPSEITDTSISLVSVAPQFVEAYEEEYRVSPERLDEMARERWEHGRRRRRPARPYAEDDDRVRGVEDDDDDRPPGGYRRR